MLGCWSSDYGAGERRRVRLLLRFSAYGLKYRRLELSFVHSFVFLRYFSPSLGWISLLIPFNSRIVLEAAV